MAQAKTGTGKTLGFLLPLIQNILTSDPNLRDPNPRFKQRERTSDIRAIVISPTRELAEQIAVVAERLVKNTSIIVQRAVGGTQKREHMVKMRREGCHLLVGTPGRLKDLLSDSYGGVSAPKLDCMVLDEADHLMDAGFWDEIEEIQQHLPKRGEKDRQTLLFSATVPTEIATLARRVLKPNLHYVKCVQDDEVPTHKQVPQKIVHLTGMENQIPALIELCERENAARLQNLDLPQFKAIVYFPSTAETQVTSQMLSEVKARSKNTRAGTDSGVFSRLRVNEIHSRLTQAARTKAANSFRAAKSAVLLSSDVTARGMDFPNVTHIIQLGPPQHREAYIHRIGRTARAGAAGEGWFLIPSVAVPSMLARLHGLPIRPDDSLELANIDLGSSKARDAASDNAKQIISSVEGASQRIERYNLNKLYNANLGVWKWFKKDNWLGRALERLAKIQWGMAEAPSLPAAFVQKMGLLGTEGINVSDSDGSPSFDRGDRKSFGRGRQQSGGRQQFYEGRQQSYGGSRQSSGGRQQQHGSWQSDGRGRSYGGDRQRSAYNTYRD